jgi:N-acyl-D-aspartate/D-glutamate deacylase
MLDLKITGARIVDGSGGPERDGDVGLAGGRIVSVGDIRGVARRTIDAQGHVVAPGFIDVHTHYDAQAMWDPTLTPTSLHGVTTVIGGNCGFTLAPVTTESRDYVLEMLACVEGMPVDSLRAVVDWRWESFGEWLSLLDGTLAVNAGFSVGHSTIRRLVMGSDFARAATHHEIEAMARHLTASLKAGAIGFSSSWGELHADHLGGPVPSRFAESQELIRLASCLRTFPGTTLEFIPSILPTFAPEAIEVMSAMSVAAQKTLNWNLLVIGINGDFESVQGRLAASDYAKEQGGRVVALTMPIPMKMRVNLATTTVYNSMPAWERVLSLPKDRRLLELQKADARAALAAGVMGAVPDTSKDFAALVIESVQAPHLRELVGRTVGDVASTRGTSPLDTLLDISIEDDLNACFTTPGGGVDDVSWSQRASVWNDDRALVGGSDAGAHLDMLAMFNYFTDFVGPTVRDRKLLTLSEAVQLLTDAPARLYGLRERGRIEEGWHGDLVIFDPDVVGVSPMGIRNDMPGGRGRLYASPQGVGGVIVNGQVIVDEGRVTSARPGTVIRGGRDTE